MWKLASKFMLLISALSLLMLVRLGLDANFVAPLRAMLDWYEALLEFCLGWAKPLLDETLAIAQAWVPIHLQLHTHWKHVLVLVWLYVAGDFTQYLIRGRTISGLLILLIGGILALVASVAAATVDFDHPSMLAVIFPVVGFALYETMKAPISATFHRRAGDTWWQTCRFYFVNFGLSNALIGAAIIALAMMARQYYQIHVPNLLLLMGFVIAIALRNVLLGMRVARLLAHEGGTWASRYNKSATGRLGVHILRAVAAVLIVVAFNAGLRFAGLP